MYNSSLYDEATFYPRFTKDLLSCTSEVIIESPYITRERMLYLFPIFETLSKRQIKVYIITRDPTEHSKHLNIQSETEIQWFEHLGVRVFICKGNHHRKLAILDRKILWEGSLNILSQTQSLECMRRIEDEMSAQEMFHFLRLERFIG